jgi:hypothetical protein
VARTPTRGVVTCRGGDMPEDGLQSIETAAEEVSVDGMCGVY